MDLVCYRANDKSISKIKNYISSQCLKVANNAMFETTYEDVQSHLFGDENAILTLVFDENMEIKGFAILAEIEIEDKILLHLHGMVLEPEIQKSGVFRELISKNVGFSQGTYIEKDEKPKEILGLSARTHNPAVYVAIDKICDEIHPNLQGEAPDDIVDILRKNPFVKVEGSDLVQKDAYTLPKINSKVSENGINELFDGINELDAILILGEGLKNLDEDFVKEGAIDAQTINRELDFAEQVEYDRVV
ncbi:MAG TPA: hypothetical protein DEP72_03590 [Clostridiales bacterium]|nr:MAG: hypothetical protein A2Y18_00760 [Clostridiales bacterium GWD2_32_19]HCC07236.1 hypothetical protein [Clostridiales bacterium]